MEAIGSRPDPTGFGTSENRTSVTPTRNKLQRLGRAAEN